MIVEIRLLPQSKRDLFLFLCYESAYRAYLTVGETFILAGSLIALDDLLAMGKSVDIFSLTVITFSASAGTNALFGAGGFFCDFPILVIVLAFLFTGSEANEAEEQ